MAGLDSLKKKKEKAAQAKLLEQQMQKERYSKPNEGGENSSTGDSNNEKDNEGVNPSNTQTITVENKSSGNADKSQNTSSQIIKPNPRKRSKIKSTSPASESDFYQMMQKRRENEGLGIANIPVPEKLRDILNTVIMGAKLSGEKRVSATSFATNIVSDYLEANKGRTDDDFYQMMQKRRENEGSGIANIPMPEILKNTINAVIMHAKLAGEKRVSASSLATNIILDYLETNNNIVGNLKDLLFKS